MKTQKLIITLFLSLCFIFSKAQSPFYFTGYGRALIAKSAYNENSNYVKNDTTSAKKSLAGNFVFDLGINVKPSEILKANVILRVNNQFGGFFSTGSLLEFRQIQIHGILAKKIAYSLGDIDLQMTKYTLFNSYEATRSEFEAEAFKIRRNIIDYDNFNNGNQWRVQGIQLKTKIEFEKIIKDLSLSAFGSRIKASNFINTPDRLLYGGTLKIHQGKSLDLGINFIGINDLPGTAQDTVVSYANKIITGDFAYTYSTRNLNFIAKSELGTSNSDMFQAKENKRIKNYDHFIDASLGVKHKYLPFKIFVSYRFIGNEYYSAGAQSRRINDNIHPTLLPNGLGGSNNRNMNIFDRFTDLNLYNKTITTTLSYYLPMYNNVLPYGAATPNRKGYTLETEYGNSDSVFYAQVNAQMLSEVIGVGISQKRNFILFNAGATLNLHKIIGCKKLLAVSSAIKYENTQGATAAKINLQSSIVDFALTFEILKNLNFSSGIKFLNAKGSENIILRDAFNNITSYEQFKVGNTQSIITTGLIYHLSKQTSFAANAFWQLNNNHQNSNENYAVHQLFFSYLLKF